MRCCTVLIRRGASVGPFIGTCVVWLSRGLLSVRTVRRTLTTPPPPPSAVALKEGGNARTAQVGIPRHAENLPHRQANPKLLRQSGRSGIAKVLAIELLHEKVRGTTELWTGYESCWLIYWVGLLFASLLLHEHTIRNASACDLPACLFV